MLKVQTTDGSEFFIDTDEPLSALLQQGTVEGRRRAIRNERSVVVVAQINPQHIVSAETLDDRYV